MSWLSRVNKSKVLVVIWNFVFISLLKIRKSLWSQWRLYHENFLFVLPIEHTRSPLRQTRRETPKSNGATEVSYDLSWTSLEAHLHCSHWETHSHHFTDQPRLKPFLPFRGSIVSFGNIIQCEQCKSVWRFIKRLSRNTTCFHWWALSPKFCCRHSRWVAWWCWRLVTPWCFR